MKLVNNLSEQEIIDQVKIVVDRIAPSYKFHGYEVDDIKQESWIICMDALNRYVPSMGKLENFLSVNLSNRLKNLIRREHYNKHTVEDKKKVRLPGQLSNEESTHYYETYFLDSLDLRELARLIDEEIPYEHRPNYIRLINGDHVPKKEKEELLLIIREIAVSRGHLEEEEECF